MPSPKNQCAESSCCGFEPLRTYRPFSSGGSAPSTRRSVAPVSWCTGAKLPRSHHGVSPAPVVTGPVVVAVPPARLPPPLEPHAASSAPRGMVPAASADHRRTWRRVGSGTGTAGFCQFAATLDSAVEVLGARDEDRHDDDLGTG